MSEVLTRESGDTGLAAPAVIAHRKPRLTIDIGPLLETQWTGIPVFTRRLVESLIKDGRVDLHYGFNLTEIPAPRVRSVLRAQSGVFLRQEYEDQAFDRYHTINCNIPAFYPSVKKCFGICGTEASVVHDISTLTMPENHEEANVAHHMDDLDRELATDDTIFCVSEATRAALDLYYPSASQKTRILYQFADWPEDFATLEHNMPRLRLGPYAVVVGTIEPRKNLAVLLRALAQPAMQAIDLKFIVIGRVGWLVDQFLAELTPDQRRRVVFSGFVSEFVKYRLIANAQFMVYPSLYEGFGIPALEALSLGKPVLAARTSSFPEVIGHAGLYFDPLSPADLAAGVAEIVHPARLAELSRLARPQAEKFNWRRMAAPVVEWVSALQ